MDSSLFLTSQLQYRGGFNVYTWTNEEEERIGGQGQVFKSLSQNVTINETVESIVRSDQRNRDRKHNETKRKPKII